MHRLDIACLVSYHRVVPPGLNMPDGTDSLTRALERAQNRLYKIKPTLSILPQTTMLKNDLSYVYTKQFFIVSVILFNSDINICFIL